MALDDFLQRVGLERPVPVAVPDGLQAFGPPIVGDDDGTESFSISLPAGTNLDERLGFHVGSVVVDNNASAFLNVLDATKDGTGRWVGPGQPGQMPLVNGISRARIAWTAPPGKVQPAFVAGEAAQITFFGSKVPPGIGQAVPQPIIAVQHLGSLAQTNVALGFNASDGPFSDAYLMGWNFFVSNGAAQAQVKVAIRGDSSLTVIDVGSLIALPSSISSLTELLPFPIRIAKFLPNDASFHVGIDSEAAYTLGARGNAYLGS